jgi:hypothetical protein
MHAYTGTMQCRTDTQQRVTCDGVVVGQSVLNDERCCMMNLTHYVVVQERCMLCVLQLRTWCGQQDGVCTIEVFVSSAQTSVAYSFHIILQVFNSARHSSIANTRCTCTASYA